MSTATLKFTNQDDAMHQFFYDFDGLDAHGDIVYEGASSTEELDPGQSQIDQLVASDDASPLTKVVSIEITSVTVDDLF